MCLDTFIKRIAFASLWLLLVTVSGCKKFVTVPAPPTGLTSGNVYESDVTAISVMSQLYGRIAGSGYGVSGEGNINGFFLAGGLCSDELTLFAKQDLTSLQYYTNTLTSAGAPAGPWIEVYNYIYTTNAVIESVTGNSALTPAVAQQLLGEAEFMRGFFYFYLVNIYGAVPLVTNTDAKGNALNARASIDSVYHQIITDLTAAQGLLSNNYLGPDLLTTTVQKVRPTKMAATALLARAYLYTKDYEDAYAQSNALINSGLFQLDSLNAVFLMNSNEAIWQLQSAALGYNPNTPEGGDFILPPTGPNFNNGYWWYLNADLVNSFEAGDNRRTDWIDSAVVGSTVYYYAYKYKSGLQQQNVQTEYPMVLRLGEQYLIRAEAEANGAGGGVSDAVTDLNVIRQRAGLSGYAGIVGTDSLMSALLKERRVELFTEWGHRWLDLKRWPVANTLNSVMTQASIEKGVTWSPDNYQALFPIGQAEIYADPNLVQNPGY